MIFKLVLGKDDDDPRVEVREVSSGRCLTGEEAPLASQLDAWLETHPGWEAVPKQETTGEAGRQDDDEDGEEYETGDEGETDGSDSDEEDAEEMKKKAAEAAQRKSIGADESKNDDERVKEVIFKAKVEDDEYKTQTGELNYYA